MKMHNANERNLFIALVFIPFSSGQRASREHIACCFQFPYSNARALVYVTNGMHQGMATAVSSPICASLYVCSRV